MTSHSIVISRLSRFENIALRVGYIIYHQFGRYINQANNFPLVDSIFSLPQRPSDAFLQAAFWICVVCFWIFSAANDFLPAQHAAQIGLYRERRLLLARATASRSRAALPLSQKLRWPLKTPNNVPNDIWDDIMRDLEPKCRSRYGNPDPVPPTATLSLR
jgi:hypothetical protein